VATTTNGWGAGGGRPVHGPARGAHRPGGAERRVAALAAEGMSNRQIAQHLFITQPTVETHLRHAFHKLGIASRAGLASRLAGDAGAPARRPAPAAQQPA
jgi:Bacterial regulatory proteins, luxR family